LRLQRALIGRYSVERELGRGGMGVVYLARDVRLDRPVAIKLLRPEIAELASFRERFAAEARTAARLSHPNIVSIHAVEAADDLVFFVMAYIDGQTLGERIRRQGPLSNDETSRVLREVAWALSYAHATGLIHRDIKADNILLERDSGRALLADFGIAHAIDSADATDLVGTTTYLSPEIIEGNPASIQSDLYALGVVGFLAASGTLPFDGQSAAEIMARHIAQPVPSILNAAPAISARLARAIDRCLAKQPADRFASGEEFAAALEHHASLVPAQPAAIQYWLRRWDRIAPMYAVAMPVVGMLVIMYGWDEVLGNFYHWASFVNWPEFVLVIALSAHAVFTFLQARRIVSEGYKQQDLIVALKAECSVKPVPRRLRPVPPLPARVIRDLTYISFAMLVAAALGIYFVIPRVEDLEQAKYIYYTLLNYLMFTRLATYIGLGVGMVYPGRYSRRSGWWPRLQLAFWRSILGSITTRVVSIGVKPRLADQTVHRPTEIALSLAADQLFAALPHTLQRQLGDVPALVKTLEASATGLRRSIDDLEAVGIGSGPGGDGHGQLVEVRRLTEQRHAEVIGALERIRMQLIRLAAGARETPELTDVLAAARRLESEIGRHVAGRDSVRRILGQKPLFATRTPTPSPT
ncbi:MAG: serine/threonine-protein kinase, partial [Gemmatimonadota bacterium]